MDLSIRKLYLVRHAESVWNKERRIQGTCSGIRLSETGRDQARLLGGRLKPMDFGRVYCSSAERAIETARLALGEDHPMTFEKELQELTLGVWEGRLIKELHGEVPESIDRWYREPASVQIEGAEDLHAFRDRAVSAMEKIIDHSDTGNVLVFTHGGFICVYLTHLFGMDINDLWSFSLPNASITTIVLDFRPRLRSFGDTSHLCGDAIGLDGMPSVC